MLIQTMTTEKRKEGVCGYKQVRKGSCSGGHVEEEGRERPQGMDL